MLIFVLRKELSQEHCYTADLSTYVHIVKFDYFFLGGTRQCELPVREAPLPSLSPLMVSTAPTKCCVVVISQLGVVTSHGVKSCPSHAACARGEFRI